MLALAAASGLGPGAAPLRAQTPPSQGGGAGARTEGGRQQTLGSFSDSVSVGTVLVPVLVRSGGRYLSDLEPDDFHLLVDGRPVAVQSFENRTDAPVSVVFLQDLSGSMANGGKIEASREAVLYFLEHAVLGDEMALVSFGGNLTSVDVPFTQDPIALRESLTAWEPYGVTDLHDAVALLPQLTEGGQYAKRAALLITDGVDNASEIDPGRAREIVQRSEVPVYVLGLGSGTPFRLDRDGKKLYRYADLLNLLASQTGGRYFTVESANDLKEAVLEILEDLRHQYVLGFLTGSGEAASRSIEVQVEPQSGFGGRKKLRILSRRGYEGGPPAGATP